MAVVILGYFSLGALMSTRYPASSNAVAVFTPRHAMIVSPCSQSGKFFYSAATPDGVNNTIIS